MAGLSFLPDLGTGTILATFQFFGNFPLVSDKLNRVLRLGAIAFAVCLSISAEISSAPAAFFVSKALRYSSISSFEQRGVFPRLASSKRGSTMIEILKELRI